MKKSTILALAIGLFSLSTFSAHAASHVETDPKIKRVNNNVSALSNAIVKGDLQVVKSIIEYGANVNEKSNGGLTPLMYAARYNKCEIIKYLLDNGANHKLKDERGNTALVHAKNSNANDAVAILSALKKK